MTQAANTKTKKPRMGHSYLARQRQKADANELELLTLRAQYQKAKTRLQAMTKERESNRRLLLEMSDIVRSLQCLSVHYEKAETDTNSVQSPQEATLENIRRKIGAAQNYQTKLVLYCEHLKNKVAKQESMIAAQKEAIESLARSESSRMSNDKKQEPCSSDEGQGSSDSDIKRDIKINALKAKLDSLSSGRDDHNRLVELMKSCKLLKQENEAKDMKIEYLEAQLVLLQNRLEPSPSLSFEISKAPSEECEVQQKLLETISEGEEANLEKTTSSTTSRSLSTPASTSTSTSRLTSKEQSSDETWSDHMFEEIWQSSQRHFETPKQPEPSRVSSESSSDVEVMVTKGGNVEVSDVSFCSEDFSSHSLSTPAIFCHASSLSCLTLLNSVCEISSSFALARAASSCCLSLSYCARV